VSAAAARRPGRGGAGGGALAGEQETEGHADQQRYHGQEQ